LEISYGMFANCTRDVCYCYFEEAMNSSPAPALAPTAQVTIIGGSRGGGGRL